ncbi:hypothetical protein NOVOSPHI9U_310022 [Novosphingobium sp. 9U]|nr:hypothetical protein NOVOSPHI9U_310022 [Novosphingobium sp. 9U]
MTKGRVAPRIVQPGHHRRSAGGRKAYVAGGSPGQAPGYHQDTCERPLYLQHSPGLVPWLVLDGSGALLMGTDQVWT